MSTAISEQKKGGSLTIKDRLNSEAFIGEIQRVLPKHVSAERMVRVALTALTRTPQLAECDQQSFFRCMLDLSQWGLEPDGRRAHLIPFRNNKRRCIECQLIVDYKGLAELAYRSGVVKRIHADVVREGDIFEYDMGEVRSHVPHFLRHDASKPKEAGEVYAAYCIVGLEGGVTKAEVLSHDEIDAIRRRSRAGNSGPWVTDWCEMAKKTAFRRVSKWLPLSAEVRDAAEHDDDRLIDGVARPVDRVTPASELAALFGEPSAIEDAADDEPGADDDPADTQSYNQMLGYLEEMNRKTRLGQLVALRGSIESDSLLNDAHRSQALEDIGERIAIAEEAAAEA